MQLKWSYWYFRDAIPENVCDHIIKEGLSRKKQIAKIGLAPIKPIVLYLTK